MFIVYRYVYSSVHLFVQDGNSTVKHRPFRVFRLIPQGGIVKPIQFTGRK